MYFIIVLNQITSTVTIQQAAVILKQKAKYNDWNQILQIDKANLFFYRFPAACC